MQPKLVILRKESIKLRNLKARLIKKKKKGKILINMRNDITTDLKDTEKITGILWHLNIIKYIEQQNLPKLTQQKIMWIINIKEIECIISILPTKKILGPDDFADKFYQVS